MLLAAPRSFCRPAARGLVLHASLALLVSALAGCPGSVTCIRANRCVERCGGPVVASGCLPCPAGTFDDFVCRDAGALDGGGPSDAGAPTDAGPVRLDAGPGSGCAANSDCAIRSASCCGTCGAATAADFVGLPTADVAAYGAAICAAEGSPGCPECASPDDPYLVAVCRTASCVGLDLRDEPLTECTTATDCVLSPRRCCDCGTLGVSDAIAYNPARGSAGAYVCDEGAPACPPCVPTFDGLAPGCVAGRCVVFGPD